MSKKALLVATLFCFHGLFERNNIKILQEQGYEIYTASNGAKKLGAHGDVGQLDSLNVNKNQIDFSRSPLSLSNLKAYKQIKKLINENNFDVIHCNTPVASFITRVAARKARKKGTKVIYTAHGFHFYKGAPLKNWLLYYTAEKICSYFTDALITINLEDYELAKRKMKAKMIYYIPGVGINIEKFSNVVIDKEQKRKDLGIPLDAFLLFSAGDINKNKNHEIIIRAISQLENSNLYYIIAGEGELESYLNSLIHSLKLEKNVKLIGYRNDIAELYKISDIFCFPSYREGLSVALMEAMSAGLPVICSKIRGNMELIQDGKNGILCNPASVEDFTKAINIIIHDDKKRAAMGSFSKEYVKKFDIHVVDKMMRDIYKNVIGGSKNKNENTSSFMQPLER